MSSVNPSHPASNCNDGNELSACHTMHTPGNDEWLELELQESVYLSEITALEVANRVDCCQDRLEGVQAAFINPNGEVVKEVWPNFLDETMLDWVWRGGWRKKC